MQKQNADMLEHIKTVSDEEIRKFVSSEKERLGSLLQGFAVTWAETENEYLLELYSNADSRNAAGAHPWPYGLGFGIGRIPKSKNGKDMFEVIPRAGRAFYYLWRREILNLKRDLGGNPY